MMLKVININLQRYQQDNSLDLEVPDIQHAIYWKASNASMNTIYCWLIKSILI